MSRVEFFKLVVRECWTFNSYLNEDQEFILEEWLANNPNYSRSDYVSSEVDDSDYDGTVEIYLSEEKATRASRLDPIIVSGIADLKHAYCIEWPHRRAIVDINIEAGLLYEELEDEFDEESFTDIFHYGFGAEIGWHWGDLTCAAKFCSETLDDVKKVENELEAHFNSKYPNLMNRL